MNRIWVVIAVVCTLTACSTQLGTASLTVEAIPEPKRMPQDCPPATDEIVDGLNAVKFLDRGDWIDEAARTLILGSSATAVSERLVDSGGINAAQGWRFNEVMSLAASERELGVARYSKADVTIKVQSGLCVYGTAAL